MKETTYKSSPEELARVKKYQQKKLALIREHKNAPCMDCGVRYPHYVMDFDHRPDEQKTLNLGAARSHGTKKLLAEIEKCDLLCANCHRVRTWRRSHDPEEW